MKDIKKSEVRRLGDTIENNGRIRKARHLDNESGKPTVPANEETEGATNALKAPPSPPEMRKSQ